MSLAVDARGVVARRGQRMVLDGADFTVPAAAVTAVIGPNGSGKSTLLYLIAGLLQPAAGSHLTVLDGSAGSERNRVSLVLQSTEVSARLPVTVREVVAMGRYARRGMLGWSRTADRDADRRAVDDAMVRLEVDPLANQQVNELSGGQRQRVFVAQGLAQQADLLLLDEPVTGLDMVSRQRILDVARSEADRGTAVVMTTHDLNEAAEADHVLLLTGGRVVQGPPAAVLVPDVLREAYGGRLLVMDSDRTVVVDDPHHHEASPPGGPWRRDSEHTGGDGGHGHSH
jgi:iron complex transport system ATP-binding protein